jgi:alkylhydroperoxidase family enzyme
MTTAVPPTDASPLPLVPSADAAGLAVAAGIPEVLASVNLVRFALRNPKMARVIAAMVDLSVLSGALDPRLREIVILRVGWRIGSVYEWSNHAPIARRVGLSDAEIVAVRTADASVLSAADLLAITVADEVLDHNVVSPATLAAARALLGDGDELLELTAIPGCYRAIGSILATYSIPLEAHVEPWAPDGHAPTP